MEAVSYVPFHFNEVFIEIVEGLWQALMLLSSAKTYLGEVVCGTFKQTRSTIR